MFNSGLRVPVQLRQLRTEFLRRCRCSSTTAAGGALDKRLSLNFLDCSQSFDLPDFFIQASALCITIPRRI